MRVEQAPHVFRNEDRRKRFIERRGVGNERRTDPAQTTERAQHKAFPWITANFGAHLLGQRSRQRVSQAEAERAYEQPEAKTPLRPSRVAKA